MKFYDRENELKRIDEFIEIVKAKGSRMLVITGRRRIGKTRLALEGVKHTSHLYFFTKKKRINEIVNEWSEEVRQKYGNIFYGNFRNLEEFLEFLFDFSKKGVAPPTDYCVGSGKKQREEKVCQKNKVSEGINKKNPLVIIFDEIQNLLFSDPSSFGTFQKVFDLNKETSRVLLVFLGSSFSLMNKIFKDKKEPLFGRASDIMVLSYLPLKAQREILTDAGLFSGESLLHLFAIFDGIPKYIEEFVDIGGGDFKGSFRSLLTSREFLWDEGENLLKEEFGKEYSSYYSILSAISRGRRRMNEIEQFAGMRDVGSYLKNLEEIYGMIERRLPVTSKSHITRSGRYYISDNFLDFWFRFIEARRALKEIRRLDTAVEQIWAQLPEYEGRKLEDMLIREMIENNPLKIDFTRAGKYWDRKGTVEIDAVFVDENRRKVYLFEVKTNKRKIGKKQLSDLSSKGGAVPEFRGFDILTGIAYLEKSGLRMEILPQP